MRLDKFLKVSRIIKRRTVANQACGAERVTLNGRPAKPGAQLKTGDVVTVAFGDKELKFRVMALDESAKKQDAASMYEIISE